MARNPRRAEYHIGIICALAIEHATVVGMLDEVYPGLVKAHGDNNNYTFGRIGGNNLVVACLPAGLTGTVSAARVASDMRRTFRDMKIGLMVGIGGGVWSERRDIRLGDVVVSQPEGRHGGVVQWDFGKTEAGGHFHRTGSLNKPPPVLLQALQAIKSHSIMDGMDLTKCLSFMAGAKPLLENTCRYPGTHQDHLFQAGYEHAGGETCEGCDQGLLVQRPERAFNSPTVHYGNIASGNQVIKDAAKRDAIAKSENIICFEMEAAGLVDDFPCLVIRGVCDYADSHKNDNWEPYAAATAAAFARMLLLEFIRPSDIARPKYDGRVHSYIPFARNEIFVGRHEQLMEIERRRAGGASKFAIFGLGGIGKTQIALELAYRVKDNHPDCSIFWIPSTNKESFRQAYNEICEDLNLAEDSGGRSDNMAIVRNYLSREDSGEWLMILDNADDHDLWFDRSQESRLIDYVPQSSNGWVIMTSRDKRVATRFASRENSIEVMRMDEGTAAQMLGNILSQDDLDIGRSNTSALLDRLCCLPLAIMQAGAYINMNHDTNAITNTWLISFDRIRKQQPLAAEYLACMSFFDAKRIPEDLLPPAEVKKEQLAAIQCLINYSFITEQRKGNFDMHRLVHMIMRNWLQRTKNYDLSVRQAVKQLTKVFDAIPSERTEVWRPYLPHVKHALSLHTEPEAKKAVHLLSLYGARLTIEGRYQESEDCSRQVLEIRTRVLGEAHDLTIFSRHQLCNPLLQQRRHKDKQYDQAEVILVEVVKMTTELLSPTHPETLLCKSRLVKTYLKQQKFDLANELQFDVLQTKRARLGEGDFSTLQEMGELADICESSGATDKAVRLQEDRTEITRKEMGPSHPDTLESMEALAVIYHKNKRCREERVIREELLLLMKSTRGHDHPDTLSLMQRLEPRFHGNGLRHKEEQLLIEGHEIIMKAKGPTHPDTLASMRSLASFYHEHGECDQSEILQFLVYVVTERTKGCDDPDTLSSMSLLASTYRCVNKPEMAEPLLVDLIERQRKVLGPNNEKTLESIASLAWMCYEQQRFKQAEELRQEILERTRSSRGPDDPETLAAMDQLAVMIWNQGRFHDAEAIFTKLLTLLSATNLGVTLFDLRRWQDAEAQFEFVMQMGAEQPKAREAVQRSITYLIRIERVTGRPTQTLHLRERLEQYEEIDSESPDEWDESEIVEDPMEIDSSSVVAPVEDMSQSRKRKASRDLSI
ncbi:violaceus kinesin [Aspergillus californicus]